MTDAQPQDSPSIHVFIASEHDPWLNLAIEDWIFKEMDPQDSVLYLWRNEPTVVIGRYQNPWKECDLSAMEQDGVHLARRQSGGGAVYQDLGNTNFTFMCSRRSYDKHRNTRMIIDAIGRFGIIAEASGRNDILVDGAKISGSAYKLTSDKAFHHGTLLIQADLDRLRRYLTPDDQKLQAKGIGSVRSRVTNLVELNAAVTHESLTEAIMDRFFMEHGRRCGITHISYETVGDIPGLRSYYEQLKDWDWRFGKTPDFSHSLDHRFGWGGLELHLDVHEGLIRASKLFSDSLYPELIGEVEKALQGCPYSPGAISIVLRRLESSMPDHLEMLSEIEVFIVSQLA